MSYQQLVDSYGYEVLYSGGDDDYQGDNYFVLRDYWRVGLLVFGFGSCSYCDAYEAAYSGIDYSDRRWYNHPPLRELADQMYESIRWFDSKEELANYVSNTIQWWTSTKIKDDILESLK